MSVFSFEQSLGLGCCFIINMNMRKINLISEKGLGSPYLGREVMKPALKGLSDN